MKEIPIFKALVSFLLFFSLEKQGVIVYLELARVLHHEEILLIFEMFHRI